MTAAIATPQVMRDRLLQAIDDQSNQICNLIMVMEVISFLEKYPITKEALEETRLGKLINDVRRNTKNEAVAKRAKNLLRTWQKLIEPVKSEVLSKGHPGASWSSNGEAHPCISSPAASLTSGKTGQELKNRNDFNNCNPPTAEKPSNGKRKSDQNEGQLLPAKTSQKITCNDKRQNAKQPPINGIGRNSEIFTESRVHLPSEKDNAEPQDHDRRDKIPFSSVKPLLSTPGYKKSPSTSLLSEASVQQQQARPEPAASGGQHLRRSARHLLPIIQTQEQEAVVKQLAPQTQSVSSRTVKPRSADTLGLEPSFNLCVQGSWSAGLDLKSRPTNVSLNPNLSCDSVKEDNACSNAGKRRRQIQRPKDHAVNVDIQTVENKSKSVRLKDRKLMFNPVTGQLKPSLPQEPSLEDKDKLGHRAEPQLTAQSKQSTPVLPGFFQQADWTELSKNEIVQSYLSQQSNVLSSSRSQIPGAHFLVKEDEPRSEENKKTQVLMSEPPPRDLPGVTREVSNEDLNRLHTQRWPGVNGCFDTKGNWYDWTECISLNRYGDETKLGILPYVCLD
ncbi:mediator of RNA polymerase II transcription subunit 26 [Aulostomus maculatus]